MHPISLTGWGIWLAVAFPVALAGEFIGSVLFNNRTGQFLDQEADGISMTRVAYGVVVAIVLMVVLLYLSTELDWMSDSFWDRHFSRNW